MGTHNRAHCRGGRARIQRRREDQVGRLRQPKIRRKLQRGAGPSRRGSKIRNMAEAKIVRVIEELDSYMIKNRESVGGERLDMLERVRNNLRLIMDFVAGKKLEEEGSSLKYWVDDVVDIAQRVHLLTGDEWSLGSINRELDETRNRILQLGVEGENKSSIKSLSPLRDGGGDVNVVDVEQDEESVLLKWILSEEGGLSAMCVTGIPGIGKTTLAWKVYNHAAVLNRYKLCAWICDYGELSIKEVLMKLILQLLGNEVQPMLMDEMENADNQSLQRMLHQHLQGKSFLIVVDDIGKLPFFESIFKALPHEANKSSRLLLSSRFQTTMYQVWIPSSEINTLKMKPLDDDRSWKLFLKLLLFGNQKFPKQLETKGREMLRSCDGLPLSIKEAATQIVINRQSGSEWEELLESIDLKETLAALESVYNKWPPQLKLCFLCLSFFKKGTPIKREKLVQVWTAGQVIPQDDEEDPIFKFYWEENIRLDETNRIILVDRLEGYIKTVIKLLDESIIEVEVSKNEHIKCIRVNGSFHTLSMAKAEETMVLETLKKGKSSPPSSHEPRHRAICCSRDEFNMFTDHDERLVSLFFRGGGYFDASELYWNCFEQLRILDFEGFGLKMLSEIIGTLTELRYLGLRDNYIEELPQSLGCLKNLEVLDIALNFAVEVPDVVWEIDSLRHIYMSDIICRKPLKIDALENLETLTYISVDNWTYEVSTLEMMTSLLKLGIEEVDEKSDISKLFASLAKLRNLDCLILRGFRFRSLPLLHGLETLDNLTEIRLDGLITKLPSADIFPPQIHFLSLINSCLNEDPMPELLKLEYLRYLKLNNAYTGRQMVIPAKSFPSIEVICLEELWHLRKIKVEDDICCPRRWEIKNCPYLEKIPRNIIGDQTREMKMLTTKRLAAKIRKLDFISKIKHVDIQP